MSLHFLLLLVKRLEISPNGQGIIRAMICSVMPLVKMFRMAFTSTYPTRPEGKPDNFQPDAKPCQFHTAYASVLEQKGSQKQRNQEY